MTAIWGLLGLAVVILVVRQVTRRGAAANALLVLRIGLHPSGASRVDAAPQPVVPQLLAVTALCYLAKLRWLFVSEPPEVLAAFREFVAEARRLLAACACIVESWYATGPQPRGTDPSRRVDGARRRTVHSPGFTSW